MPGLTEQGAKHYLDGLVRADAAFFGILDNDPDAGGNEITYTPEGGNSAADFRRPAAPTANWSEATVANPSVIMNTTAMMFQDPADGQNPPKPEYWGIYDAATGGNLLLSGEISPEAQDPEHDSVISIPVNGIVIRQPSGVA